MARFFPPQFSRTIFHGGCPEKACRPVSQTYIFYSKSVCRQTVSCGYSVYRRMILRYPVYRQTKEMRGIPCSLLLNTDIPERNLPAL